ncbi:hypothetical protein DMH15_29535 [Streptomyces sp. WAC 06725]|uniref:hypothetical protein n=1 Tax=Streptomyces sp. WAC 06725 TaxID=2203209 RepID=UPI000F744DA2|nr:hypothetical protein [Streptomyces sp. WAC 06725]RSO26417.1 hypothetical protein DMH15_29535 [Streptomyces sp. WAC 06725]
MTRIAQRDQQLRPTPLQCLTHLADGLETVDVARELDIKLRTFHSHMNHVRRTFGPGSYASWLHRAYLTRQIPLPKAVAAPIAFTRQELRLWTALAIRPDLLAVAAAAGLTRPRARGAIRDLAEKAKARTEPHLIKLGHAYRLLPGPTED